MKNKKEPLHVFKELAKKTTKRFRELGITRADIAKEVEEYRKGH